MKRKREIKIRLGPLALSLLAAGITAVGLAAVSLADSGGGSGGDKSTQTFEMPAPPGGARGATVIGGPDISDADRKKVEEFRQCMEDNGAPGPPSHVDPSEGPPKPPSAADREELQKAFEACKDKLPEDLQKAGPPMIGSFKCGPPPGQPGDAQGKNQNQSYEAGTSSSGSSS